MSPKELLYIEDALGHEKQMKDLFTGFPVRFRTRNSKTSYRISAPSIRTTLTSCTGC